MQSWLGAETICLRQIQLTFLMSFYNDGSDIRDLYELLLRNDGNTYGALPVGRFRPPDGKERRAPAKFETSLRQKVRSCVVGSGSCR